VSPLKVLNPRNAGASSWSYLATYGGGLVGGDALRISIDVGRAARALISTQASTKVYRSDVQASQDLSARIGDEALLVLLPDPICCFASARYRQRQELTLDPTASLVLVDRLTAGRVKSGERWMFERYESRTRIWRSGRLLVHDALRLSSEDGDLAERMGRFNCLVVIALIGPLVRAAAARLAAEIGSAPAPRRGSLLMSAAPLESDGVLVRLAAESTEHASSIVRRYLDIVPSLLGDDPWARRW
jgi:urease accessory protein